MSVGGPQLPPTIIQDLQKATADHKGEVTRIGADSNELRFGDASGNLKGKVVKFFSPSKGQLQMKQRTDETADKFTTALKNELVGKTLSERSISAIKNLAPGVLTFNGNRISDVAAKQVILEQALGILETVRDDADVGYFEPDTYASVNVTPSASKPVANDTTKVTYSDVRSTPEQVIEDEAGYSTVTEKQQKGINTSARGYAEVDFGSGGEKLRRSDSISSTTSSGYESAGEDSGFEDDIGPYRSVPSINGSTNQASIQPETTTLGQKQEEEIEQPEYTNIGQNREDELNSVAYGNVRQGDTQGLYADSNSIRQKKAENINRMIISSDRAALSERLENTSKYELLKDFRTIASKNSADVTLDQSARTNASVSIQQITARMAEVRAEEYFQQLGGQDVGSDRSRIAVQAEGMLKKKGYNQDFKNMAMSEVHALIQEYDQFDIGRGMQFRPGSSS